MSQNFSKISDVYTLELIELDSYWQKAVEDAVYDTLKGEKRLYHALKNKKKINEKLAELGLKSLYSQMSLSGRFEGRSQVGSRGDNRDRFEREKSGSRNTECDSCRENSRTTLESVRRGHVCSQASPEPDGVDSFTPVKSKSKSKDRKDTPPEKVYRNPEKPVLGNGSLEKMKKSQNSFYCEPMGAEAPFGRGEELPLDYENGNDLTEGISESAAAEGQGKRIEWLHFRDDTTFVDSDTEMANDETLSKEKMTKGRFGAPGGENCLQKSAGERRDSIPENVADGIRKNVMNSNPKEKLFRVKEMKNAIRENAGLKRKLYFALAKSEIVNRKLKRSSARKKGNFEIKINESEAKLAKLKKRKSKKFLSPFVKFYLKVYRELCHNSPVKKIGAEAAARWWRKSLGLRKPQKSKNKKKCKKN